MQEHDQTRDVSSEPEPHPATRFETGEDPFGPPRQPPIGIVHIMLWTACSAVILATYRWLRAEDQMPAEYQSYFNVSQVFVSLIYGVAISGLAIFVHRRLTGGAPFPVQPGHWLLLASGSVFLVSWLGYVAIQTLHRVEADFAHSNMLMAAHHFLSFGLGAVLYGFAAWLLVADRYWTVCLWVQCGLSVLDAFSWLPLAVSSAFVVFQAARTITSCASILIVVWVIVAVALDWQRRRRRDWLHWAGVAVVVSSTLLMLASSLWFWLVNRFP